MTKGEYCKKKGIHFCCPKFDLNEEADEDFIHDIDDIVHLVKQTRGEKNGKKRSISPTS